MPAQVGRTRRICTRARTSKDRKLNPLRKRIAGLGIASLVTCLLSIHMILIECMIWCDCIATCTASKPKVCKDQGDKDHDDDDSNDAVPASGGLRMLSFESLSLASGSSSGSSTSGTLSSCLSVRDSEVSRLASQLQGLRLLSKESPGHVGSSVTTTASLFDFAAKTDSKPADIPAVNKPEKILPSRVSQLPLYSAWFIHDPRIPRLLDI